MSSVRIVDYGIANPHRLMQALSFLSIRFEIIRTPEKVQDAHILIIPDGYDDELYLKRPMNSELSEAILLYLQSGKPLLAIGLGQTILSSGFNAPDFHFTGLGFFETPALRFKADMLDAEGAPLRCPHLGYSYIVGLDRNPLISGLAKKEMGVWFYFKHRLYLCPRIVAAEVAVAHHGIPFSGAIWRDNVVAVQFLPELSGSVGLRFLDSWYRSCLTK